MLEALFLLDVTHMPPTGVFAYLTLAAAVAAALFTGFTWYQMRRSANIDIALRLLERCDSLDVLRGEALVRRLHANGYLASQTIFDCYLNAIADPQERALTLRLVSLIISNYEHIGLAIRKINAFEVTAMVTDYLVFKCPDMFQALMPLIQDRRSNDPWADEDFEWLAGRCERLRQRREPPER